MCFPSMCFPPISSNAMTDFDPTTKRPMLYSQMIEKAMGPGFSCGVLMGANVADEVAMQHVCESTLACQFNNPRDNQETVLLFDTPNFRVQHTTDIVGAEICGAIKNCIAIGAGFVDGLKLGSNTKAALLRVGLLEIYQFAQSFFPNQNLQYSTLMESCGLADLFTTCYNGRNRKCAQVFAQEWLLRDSETNCKLPFSNKNNRSCRELWEDIERRLLNGQKLQGIGTLTEVYQALQTHHILHRFPLINAINDIACGHRPLHSITDGIRVVKDSYPPAPHQRSYL
jgi:glycerol-3-phosphate dehydrogenase (NAD+)